MEGLQSTATASLVWNGSFTDIPSNRPPCGQAQQQVELAPWHLIKDSSALWLKVQLLLI